MDPQSTAEALLAHEPFVRGLARALLGGDGLVEDVVQDTWLIALTKEQLPPRRPWLGGVVRKLILTIRRRDAARRRRESATERRALPSPPEILGREEIRARVVRSLLRLREPYRSALLYRFYEDLPPREIARVLGVPAETVRTRVRRGLELLRRELDRESGEGRPDWATAILPLAGTWGGGLGGTGNAVWGALIMSMKTKFGMVGAAAVLFALIATLLSVLSDSAAPPRLDPTADGTVAALDGRAARRSEASVPPSTVGAGESKATAAVSGEQMDTQDGQPAAAKGGLRSPGRASGSVTAQDTGLPIAGARVTLVYDAWRAGPPVEGAREPHGVESDDAGGFRIGDLLPGTYSITVEHPDYAPRTLTGILIAEGRGAPDLAVALVGAPQSVGALAGRVADPDGRPVADALISIRSSDDETLVETRTDESGIWRVARLLPGRYLVRYMPPGASRLFADMRNVSVVPGKTGRVEFEGTGALTGIVLDPEGVPMPGVLVLVNPLDGAKGFEERTTTAGPDGRFTIDGGVGGRHRIRVQSPKERWIVTVAEEELTGRGQHLELRLPTGKISGRLTLAGTGEPPSARGLFPGLTFHALTGGGMGHHVANAFPGPDGGFVVRGVAAGRYRLSAHLRGYRVAERDVDLRPGESLEGVDLEFEKLVTGWLKLRVWDLAGRPVDGLLINYLTSDGKARTLRADRPEPGLYFSRQIEPGTRILSLYRADLKPKSVTIDIPSEESVETEVTMAPR